MRITENLIALNFLRRTGDTLSRMAAAQEQMASGRKLLKPSDDPLAMSKSLAIRHELRSVAAWSDNASSATAFMSSTEDAMQEISDLLSRGKELILAGNNDTTDPTGAEAQALELRSIVEALIQISNRDIGGRSIFGGRETNTPAYSRIGGNVVYRGDDGDILEQLGKGLLVGINLNGPQAFQTVPSRIHGDVDLDPALSTTTLLSSLRDGNGIVPATIQLEDGNGVVADVALGGAENIGEVLAAINNAGTGIVATISADRKAIELTDTTGGGSFTVRDVQGGDFAQSLGLETTSDTGTILGTDLEPAVSEDTPMALLFGGAGIPPGTWTLRNTVGGEQRSAVIDPGQANTLGDLLDLVNSARTPDGQGLGLRATLDGRGLSVTSTIPQTTIGIDDSTPGGSASIMGVAGVGTSLDVFALLEQAAAAVESRDHDAMDAALADIDAAIHQTSGIRGTYGARARQVLTLAENLQDREVDVTLRLSDVEDADLAQAAIELTKAETVYNASLATGTRMLELSLFNYIR